MHHNKLVTFFRSVIRRKKLLMNYGFKIGVIDVFEQTSLSKSTFYDDETGKHLFKEITHLFN
ncbi:hypothetical protein DIU36_22920 [Mucilaginibacter rubeus]|nr:hypothetical protein [Mucilaginibacter rubeus]RAV53539.1 hypothetical protein DIU36_22920 [Mucilaginibacter rubeus]